MTLVPVQSSVLRTTKRSLAAVLIVVLAAPLSSAFHQPLSPHTGLTPIQYRHACSRPQVVIKKSLHTAAFGGNAGGNNNRGGTRRWGNGDGGGEGDEGRLPQLAPMQLWTFYLAKLDSNPIKTRMITGFFISFIGDIMSQTIEGTQDYNLKRILVFASWGACGFPPIGYYWYNWLEKVVPMHMPARFVAKTFLDRALSPPVMISLSFTVLTTVEGLLAGVGLTQKRGFFRTGKQRKDFSTSFADGMAKARRLLLPTLIENYKVWPAVQMLNFALVPVKLQILFNNLVAVWWYTYLSLTQHKKDPKTSRVR